MKTFYTLLSLAFLFLGLSLRSQAQVDTVAVDTTCTTVSYTYYTGPFPGEMSFGVYDSSGNVVFVQNPTGVTNATIVGTWCLPSGCYSVVMNDTFGDGWNGGNLIITVMGGGEFAGTVNQGNSGVFQFGINASGCGTPSVIGCMDPSASNFNPNATVSGNCLYAGCMDPSAINFDPSASVSDSSCEYCNSGVNANLYICTFSNGNQVSLSIADSTGQVVFSSPTLGNAAIYNTNLCLEPGMCYTAIMTNTLGLNGWNNGYFWINYGGAQIIHTNLPSDTSAFNMSFSIDGTCGDIPGCTDPIAINYDTVATLNDGSCYYSYGCTDSTALNYNASAVVDDGSCIYTCDGSLVNMIWTSNAFGNEMSFTIQDQNQAILYAGYGTTPAMNSNTTICLPADCYLLTLNDNFGDGWDGQGNLAISINGGAYTNYTIAPFSGYVAYYALSLNNQDCSWLVPVDNDQDGFMASEDCNDNNASVYPGAWEVADSLDNDCDGIIDNGLVECTADITLIPDSLTNTPFTVYVLCNMNPNNPPVQVFWDLGNGDVSNEFYPQYFYDSLGTYTLCYTALYADSCYATECIVFTVDNNGGYFPGGIQQNGFWLNVVNQIPNAIEEEQNNVLSLYPNPAQDEITLQLNQSIGNSSVIKIYGIQGNLIQTIQPNQTGNSVQISIQDLASGMYLMQVESKENVYRTSFIKN